MSHLTTPRKAPEWVMFCFVRLPTRCLLDWNPARLNAPDPARALNSFSIFGRPLPPRKRPLDSAMPAQHNPPPARSQQRAAYQLVKVHRARNTPPFFTRDRKIYHADLMVVNSLGSELLLPVNVLNAY